MATTIKLKNGSGAPTAGDLVQGEPAIDLTNKRLYTEDSGGSVIEVGSNPSSLSIAGTAVTATATELNTLDGITSTTAELNILDGVTATAAELNVLDGVTAFVDEDDMVSNSATSIPSQQSVKAYVDAQVTASDLDFQGDSGGALSIDLDSETLTIAGGAGIDTSGATNTLTVAIDSTVATLTGTQTLTNKTLTSPIISSISNTGTLTLPTSTDTLVGRATTDTLTNKTLTSPVISSISNTGTLTLPTSTDTLVGRATTDTLTNKTLTSAVLNTGVSGTAVLDEDDMSSNSATQLATQQSIKAYVDAQVAGADTLAELTDTNITTPADGALLFYDTTTSKWIDNVVSGDVTIADTGVAAISSGVIVNDDINASAAISVSKTALTAGTGLTLTSDTLSVDASQTQITAVGTIGTGTWQGSVISDTYVANDLTISGGTIENTIIGAATPAAGTFTTFTSTGIDDNATSTAITIDSSENTTFAGTITSGDITVSDATPFIRLQDSDITNGYTQISNVNGNAYIGARNDTADGIFVVGGYGGGTFTEWARWSDTGNLTQKNNLIVQGTFTSLGIDDNATSTAITIDSSERTSFSSSTNRPVSVVSTDTNSFVSFQDTNSASIGHVKIGSETNDMVFYANAQERMRIDSSGNVGIGTASPGRLLHLESAGPAIRMKDTSGTGTIHELITSGANGQLLNLLLDAGGAGTSPAFIIKNVGTELMRVNSSGNVGIGTSSPLTELHVAGSQADGSVLFRLENEDTSITTNDLVGELQFYANDGSTNGTGVKANIKAVVENAAGNLVGLSFGTSDGASATAVEAMRIDAYGNVGIGPTSPLNVSNYTSLQLDGATGGLLSLSDDGTEYGRLLAFADNCILTQPSATGNIHFRVGGTSSANERMRIDSSGRLLVGGSDAGSGTNQRLVVFSTGNYTTAYDTGGSAIHINNNAATAGSGNFGGGITFGRFGSNSDDISAAIAPVQCSTDEDQMGIAFFYHGSNTRTVALQEGFRLDNSGNLLVGQTSVDVIDTSNFGAQLRPNGEFRSYRNTAGSGAAARIGGNAGQVLIYGDGDLANTNNSYGSLSDERLKSNIVDASSQIDDIMAVQVRSYTLDSTGDTHIGVVAQELEASGMSGLVKTDDEGMKSVKYSVLYMKAIKALQEAVTRIETLEAEVAALKGA